jgi:hypothetical protein
MALIDPGTDPALTPGGTGYLGRPEGSGITYGDPAIPPTSTYSQDGSDSGPNAESDASITYADGSGQRSAGADR